MDTQVSSATLQYLGDKFNQTTHQYSSDDGSTHREFLLDINPWIWERERGDGMNVIDARWIDTRNGLFIDICDVVIIGQGDVIEQLLAAIFTRGHVLLVGVPGLVGYVAMPALGALLVLAGKAVFMLSLRSPALRNSVLRSRIASKTVRTATSTSILVTSNSSTRASRSASSQRSLPIAMLMVP